MTAILPATFLPGASLDDEPWIAYIRVSTWREEKISPEIQRAAIKEWARRNRKRIVKWIPDLDVSGRTFKRKIMGAIEMIENGKARGIVVWRYSRFGRDRVGNAVNLARVENVGGMLISATEPVDAATAIGRFQRGMMLEFAAFESDRTGEQWKEVHAHRLGLLLPSGGRPRFGYIWHRRRIPDATAPDGWRLQQEWYEPDVPTEAGPALADAYLEHVNMGTGFKTLAEGLTEQGFVTTRGKRWTDTSLLRYMDSGFPAGLLQVRDNCMCPKNKKSSCRHWRRFQGAQEPLISEEAWEAYGERRKTVASRPPRARHATYEHTSLTKCIRCRGAMTAHPKDSGDAYWRCVRRDHGGDCEGVTATDSDLKKIVREFMEEVAEGIDCAPVIPINAPRRPVGPDPAAEKARLTAEHAKWSAALTRLITDYAVNPDRYPDAEYDKARKDMEGKRDAALEGLAKFEETEKKEETPKFEDLRPLVVGVLPEWETFTVQHRNTILHKIIRHILVSPRPSRFETAARVVPVWAPVEEAAHGAAEASVSSEDMFDGIAWSIA
ncbi:hypothetical protein A8W25_11725 [Streptomyces sp. ERV7]|uniref:recombinase family protein n=1 Tax=Streptomyces sp. ERV7 TaxID=1322334 RepID=UPI0007F47CDB|nr:recombinase family protein [Streptomyces sp. ERV7]OAR26123.1 hypothetical protein A8W25_11725 [Streptomyces sp. ERV7]